MYKEHIMRLEFDKEDLKQQVNFFQERLLPGKSNQSGEPFKPVFGRTSIGRARLQAEASAARLNRDKK